MNQKGYYIYLCIWKNKISDDVVKWGDVYSILCLGNKIVPKYMLNNISIKNKWNRTMLMVEKRWTYKDLVHRRLVEVCIGSCDMGKRIKNINMKII